VRCLGVRGSGWEGVRCSVDNLLSKELNSREVRDPRLRLLIARGVRIRIRMPTNSEMDLNKTVSLASAVAAAVMNSAVVPSY
jgi:hypothetical protein